MSRSYPLAESSVFRRQFSARKESGLSLSPTRHSPHATRQFLAGFTLIELLVVVAVIAILAGLTLSIMGTVQKKSARSRAQTEVASISAAIDNYFLDNGGYPAMDPGSSNTTTALYAALCPRAGAAKVYLEPSPSMVDTNGTNRFFIDPWGGPYKYSTDSALIRNVGTYDFWSDAGTTSESKDDIRN